MRARLRPAPGLEDRLRALARLVELAEGRLPRDEVARLRALQDRAGRRIDLGVGLTVAALAGPTGSGKSSLFNVLAGDELAEVGVIRPTTTGAQACVWGEEDAADLLQWLGVNRYHRASDPALDGLVLLDLPDFDSTEAANRIEADRLVGLVDLLLWVVDPQKYADASLHEGYLLPLAGHAGVSVVVLNQCDRLERGELQLAQRDLRRLLDDEGLARAPLLCTSARTGRESELREVLARRVTQKRAALERLDADLAALSRDLESICRGPRGAVEVTARLKAGVVDAFSEAAQVPLAAEAAAGSYTRGALLATGWPVTRWLKRLRPDPLRRLGLQRGSGEASSLPRAGPAERARVMSSLRRVGDEAGEGLAAPWPDRVRGAAAGVAGRVEDRLDRIVTGADLTSGPRPRWWSVVGLLQWLLLALACLGAVWLTALFVVAWLQLPSPPTPRLGDVPLPTALLLGGLVAGVLLALLSRPLVRVGASRRRRWAALRLRRRVEDTAEEEVFATVRAELEARAAMCEAIASLRGRRPA